MSYLPFLLSFLIGYFLVEILFQTENRPSWPLHIFLGAGLGLGISAHLTFYGFLLYSKLCPEFAINSNLCLLVVLLILKFTFKTKKNVSRPPFTFNWQTGTILSSFIIASILVVKMAFFYPNGGWDAWQVWNFKARFLYLGAENWANVFAPELWRSSPHYPLLLPLINVWAWLFTQKPAEIIPLITSVVFTLLTAGLLSAALWQKSKNYFSILPGLLMLTLPFFNLLATSQYCDIVLAFYLVAAIITLAESFDVKKSNYALLSGLMAGLLGFTKPEGLVATLLLCGLAGLIWVWSLFKKRDFFTSANLGLFILGLAIASIPIYAFQFLYSPGNQTFINGLTSTQKASTITRMELILIFLWKELISGKWNGLWFLALGGIILGGKRAWTGKNILTAGFWGLYLLVILAYYEINTYFEIKWWLSVSLNRILFSLLPLALFWAFSSLLEENHKKSKTKL